MFYLVGTWPKTMTVSTSAKYNSCFQELSPLKAWKTRDTLFVADLRGGSYGLIQVSPIGLNLYNDRREQLFMPPKELRGLY